LPGEQIMRLMVEQRLVLALVDLEKLEYAQAANVTGLSIWKIRHHLGDAWQSLILSSNLA
jgi:DNA-directed RNA polymerase specialized sigma24 family protein